MTSTVDVPHLRLDPSLRTFAGPGGGTTVAGGQPGRVLRLGRTGEAAFRRLVAASTDRREGRRGTADVPPGADDALLAGRLVEAGMAHPRPRRGLDVRGRVTVVVPVRDRAHDLERCLGALGRSASVIVVDDGSADPAAIGDVCRRHGAGVIRRERSGGPGAARNDGWAAATTELVAFVDSDCVVPDGWLGDLAGWFDDPGVVAVAPRVRPAGRREDHRVLARFEASHGPLDLGGRAGPVGPGRAVAYVPTTALVVRRDLPGIRFDTALRYGEDVDLVWRLGESGSTVRYDPDVVVHHREPRTWAGTLARRFRYGTSAAPLARRHRGRPAAVEVRPVPAAITLLALAGLPSLATATLVVAAGRLAHRVRPFAIPAPVAASWVASGAWWTAIGLGRSATMLASPALAVAAAGRLPGGHGRWAARFLLLAPPLVDWWRLRPDLDPVRWTLASAADDVAYGLGVWAGCLSHRTAAPLLIRVTRQRDRGTGSPADASTSGSPA
ncbi:MAG: mycofactocin biosynthesis glycosyltransferase MftF [Actinomycetota bacterium]|nr:mycofactocin biosynthesis glycosyltransferase MftF [Actinomycetota bacterium]